MNRLKTALLLSVCLGIGCDGSQDKPDETDKENPKDSPEAQAGTLAIVTVDENDRGARLGANDDTNLRTVNLEGELLPMSSQIQIESAELVQSTAFVAATALVNPYNGHLFVVLDPDYPSDTYTDCSILRKETLDAAFECVAEKTNIVSFFDNNNNNQQDQKRKTYYLRFDGVENTYFMAQTDAERDADQSPSIYKISADGGAPVAIATEAEFFIRSFDVNSEGAVFYFAEGKADDGNDDVKVKIVKPDGDVVEMDPAEPNVLTTKILFFAVDRFGGLIYAPEIHSTSDHHIYKMSFDDEYLVTQAIKLSEEDSSGTGVSTISWPTVPLLDNQGRLFFRANKSTDSGDDAPYLFMFAITKDDDSFLATQTLLTSSDETVETYVASADYIYYDGYKTGDQSARFFRRRPLAGGDFEVVAEDLSSADITEMRVDSVGRVLITACELDGSNCSFRSLGDSGDVQTAGLGTVTHMEAAATVIPEEL